MTKNSDIYAPYRVLADPMTNAAAARKIAEDLIALAAKATPSEWSAARQDEDDGSIYWAIHAAKDYEFITNGHTKANSEYIAAANPEAITALAKAYLSLSRPQAGTLTKEAWLKWDDDAARKLGRVLAIWVWRAADGLSTGGQDTHEPLRWHANSQAWYNSQGDIVSFNPSHFQPLPTAPSLTTPPATEEDA